MNFKKLLPGGLLILMLLLVGCFSDSGNNEETKSTPPVVVSTTPFDGAVSVAPNTKIQVTFSTEMDKLALNSTNFSVSGKSGTITYSSRVATFTPASDFAYNETYTVTLLKGIKDTDGNTLEADYTFSFTTSDNPDKTPPRVVSKNIADNAFDVLTRAEIKITFSEEMDASTMIANNFRANPNGASYSNLPSSVTYENRVATIVFNLNTSTTYTFVVKKGVKDLGGNNLQNEYGFQFTTTLYTYPTVISTTPIKGGIYVDATKPIKIVFSREMDASTINNSTITVKYQAGGTYDVNGTWSYSNRVATFTPSETLPVDSTIIVNVSIDAKDLNGNGVGTPITTNSYSHGYSFSFTTGIMDKTFVNSSGFRTISLNSYDEEAKAVAVQPDGKIILAGYTVATMSGDSDFAIVRLNANGTFDQTFGTSGKVSVDFNGGHDVAHAVKVLSDNAILVAGYANNGSNNDFAIVKLTASGSLDTSFGTGGKVITAIGSYDDIARDMVVDSGNRIILAGYAHNGSNTDIALACYTANGSLDSTFNSTGKVITNYNLREDKIYAMALQSNQKIIVAGYTNVSGTNNDFLLARYNTNGSVDTSFGTSGFTIAPYEFGVDAADEARAVAVQPDGKIVAAGFRFSISANYPAVMRFTSSGVLDTAFNASGKSHSNISGEIHSVAVQDDDKIVAGGFSGLANHDIALYRLNTDGSKDKTFSGDGFYFRQLYSDADEITSLAIQPDGMIVAAGFVINGNYDMLAARFWY